MQLTNANIRRGAKEWHTDHFEDYQEARDEAFNEEFQDTFMKMVQTGDTRNFIMKELVTEDDIQGFIDAFTFKDEDDWLSDEYASYIGDLQDQAYDSYKDEQFERRD